MPKPPLTNDEVYERLHVALLALGTDRAETDLGDTTLKTARRAIATLQAGFLAASDRAEERNSAIIDPSKGNEP